MNVTRELSSAWREAVASGSIANEFEASLDDPAGRWLRGDRIRFGLVWTGDAIEYNARNLRTNTQIEASVREKTIGSNGFLCQFNGYRALRPGGASRKLGRQPDISPEPADCRFYCQDPGKNLSLLKRNPLLQVSLRHGSWNSYYNATPFEKEGHFLWIPVIVDGATTVIPHFPQMLTRDFVEDLVELSRYSTGTIVFFNSLHAGASVNHIHAQAVVHERRLAIEDARTIDYKGFCILDHYPAQAICFQRDSDVSTIASCVERLQVDAIPYNLILLGERIFLVPRNSDQEIVSEFPGGVLATMEIAGKIITANRDAYENFNATQIESAFQKVTLSARQLIDGWGNR
jgi:hypothetical protein